MIKGVFLIIFILLNKNITKISLSSPDSVFPGGFGGGSYTNGCDLQYSLDGSNWITITTLSGFSTGTTQDYINTITARYIRVFRASGYVALSEFRVFYSRATEILNPSYLRMYATSGLIKGTCYVYGLKKSNTFLAPTNTFIAPEADVASNAPDAPDADSLLYQIQTWQLIFNI